MRNHAWKLAPLIFVLASAAGALEADRAISQYAHRAWRMENGLPNSVVRGILQTNDGYVWVATYEGLARFNGDTFTRFDKSNFPMLRRDTVLAFMKTRDESLWVGTNGGGAGFLRDGTMRVLTTADGLGSDVVNALAEGRDGTVWIGTSTGLFAFRNGRVEKQPAAQVSISSLAVHRDGALWIGTRGDGVLVLRDGAVTRGNEALAKLSVLSLLTDADGSVWAGTNQGLHRITPAGVERIDGIPPDQVTALLRDSDGTLWIGTYSSGLYRFARGAISRFSTAEGLLNNSVRSLFEDVEKNLWVGSNGGVECLTRGKFITVGTPEGLADPYARSVFEDHAGNIWIGTAHGLTRFGAGGIRTFTTKDGLVNDYIFSIAQAPDGAMWIGTPTGLNRLENERVTAYSDAAKFAGRSVRALFFDRTGVLWIGTDRGAVRYTNGRFEDVVPADKWDLTFVLGFEEAPDGTLWIASDGRGLARWRDGRFTTWSDRDGLPDTHILSLHARPDGTLWIGTDSAGLIRMKDGRFTRFNVATGLWSDKVMQLLEDTHGRMWFGGGRGIWSVSVRELEEVAAGKRARVTSTVFGSGDGVRSVECNGSVFPSAMRTRDGRLWFSTVDGVATILPRDAAPRNLRPPPVRVEAVMIDGKSASMAQPITVAPGAKRIEIHFAALTYAAPERVQFRYRLEGFDHDWQNAGEQRTAFYTGLPPGDYAFHVIAANADGIWNRTGATLPLKIQPRFVQTLWFPVLILLALVSGVWLLQQRRVYVMKRRETELMSVVDERTAEIAHALVEAEAANRAKSIFLANVSHELRTPLNAIIGFAGVLLRDGETSLNERQMRFMRNIEVSGEHLLALINDILDLAKVEAGKMTLDMEPVFLRETFEGVARVLKGITIPRGIELEIDVQPEVDAISADGVKLKQIIYNLVSNAVKFSPDGSTIHIAARRLAAASSPLETESVAISVADHGIGIAPEHQQLIFDEFRQVHEPSTRRPAGTGLGLTLVKKFVELHGGVVQVESTLGTGSTFTVILPWVEQWSAGAAAG